MKNEKLIKVAKMISDDMKSDVIAFEGKPFNGKTVSEYFGSQAAAIQALANILVRILEETSDV